MPHKNKHNQIESSFENRLVKAIEKAITNSLKSFGADPENQQEMQKDFHFLRHLRKRSEDSGHSIMKTSISIGIGATAVAIWEGIKTILQK